MRLMHIRSYTILTKIISRYCVKMPQRNKNKLGTCIILLDLDQGGE
jgi:hypothetical protein